MEELYDISSLNGYALLAVVTHSIIIITTGAAVSSWVSTSTSLH